MLKNSEKKIIFEKIVEEAKTFENTKTQGTGGRNARYGHIPMEGLKAIDVYACAGVGKNALDHSFACHAMMASISFPEKVLASYSLWVPGHKDLISKEANDAYFDWIASPFESPWHKLFTLQDQVEVQGVKLWSKDFWKKYGWLFYERDKLPANLVQNFLVATRSAHEWPKHIEEWYKLTQKGVHPSIAYAFILMFSFHEAAVMKGKIKFTGWDNKYDWPIDTANYETGWLKRFISGDVQHLGKVMAKTVDYKPVNVIWGKPPAKIEDRYYQYLFNTYKDYGNVETSAKLTMYDTVPQNGTYGWTLSYDDLLKIIFTEQGKYLGR